MRGLGMDDQTIANFMRKLGTSPYFDGVDLVETHAVRAGRGAAEALRGERTLVLLREGARRGPA